MNGTRPVGLTWVAILGFVRIATHRQILGNPLPVAVACQSARAWLSQPYVAILGPGDRHAEILFGLLESLGTAATSLRMLIWPPWPSSIRPKLHSTDADFARFPGLRWVNPLG